MSARSRALIPLSAEQQAAMQAVAVTEQRRRQGRTLSAWPYATAFFRCLNGSRRISLTDLRFFAPALTKEEFHGNRLLWLAAVDKLIESFGEVCVLPLPSDAGHRLFPSVPFREGERRRQKTTLTEQKYSRQREREAERRELEYQTCFAQAQIDLRQQFQQMGYRSDIRTFNSRYIYTARDNRKSWHNVTGSTVIAAHEGKTPQQIIIMAHLDTYAPLSDADADANLGGLTLQGMDDNAAGLGVMLELAERLKNTPTEYGIRFVATSGEEEGKLGAENLLKRMSDTEKKNTLLVINLDNLIFLPQIGRAHV